MCTNNTDIRTLGSGLDAAPIIDHIMAKPGVQKVPSAKLTLFLKRGFLAPDLCATIIDRIDAVRRPSTIADSNGDAAYRTSETGDLDPDDAAVIAVERALAVFTGLSPEFGEPLQGQRYAVGQEFKPHTDYFEPGNPDYERYCSVAGNRTWTVMVYLNQPDAGGATRFKAIDRIVQPETGKLIAWNNRRLDQSLNPATIHHGMKVRSGVKYVITKWHRERPWG